MSDFRIYGESVPDLVPDNEGSPKLLRESRRLAASAGAAWIGQAWGLFTRRWGVGGHVVCDAFDYHCGVYAAAGGLFEQFFNFVFCGRHDAGCGGAGGK